MASAFHDRDATAVILGKVLFRGTLATIVAMLACWFWLLHTQSGAAFAWRQLESAMGSDLTADFSGGDFSNGIEIRNLRLSTSAVDLSIDSSRAAVDVDLVPLRANVSNVRIKGVTVLTKESDTASEVDLNVESMLSGLRFPVRLDLADARADKVSISSNTEELLSIESVETSIFWHNAISIRSLRVQRGDDSLSIRGEVDLVEPQSIDLEVDASYQTIGLKGGVSGNAQSIELQDLVIDGEVIKASASAVVRVVDGIRGSGNINIQRLDPAAMTEAWPASHPVATSFDFEATPDMIRVSEAMLSIEGTDTSLELEGSFDPLTSTVTANVNWSKLQWPIDSASPDITSADGKVTLDGFLDNWQVDGRVAVATDEMPDGLFRVDARGDRDRVDVTIGQGKVFGGSVAGKAAYTWRDDQTWFANLTFNDLQTTGLVPDWPGAVSGKAEANGALNPLAVDIALQNIHGVIRGEALAADGSLSWSGGSASAAELSITHGNTELFLNGSADTVEGLLFSANVEVESYVDSLSGFVESSGRLSLREDKPYLSLDLSSTEMQVGDVRIAGIRLSDDRAEDAVAGFVLNVDQIQADGQEIADFQLLASIRQDQQQVDLTGFSRGSEVGLSLTGAFEDWNSAIESPWRGRVTSFSVDLQDEHRLHLEQEAEIELTPTNVSIQEFCLADDVSSHLCVNFSRESDGHIDLRAELSSVPVAAIEHVIDINVSFDQHVSGVLNWVGDPATGATGRGHIELSPGSITSTQQPSTSFVTGAGQFDFEITDGDLLTGTALLPLPGVGGISANFRVLDLTEVATSEIAGHLNVTMTDIAPVALFLQAVDSATGELHADLDLTGSFLDPLLIGSVALNNGALSYRPIGMEIDKIELLGELTSDSAIELSGTFRAGEGHGEIFSSADYRDTVEPGIRFQIRGDELLLVDVPDIHVTAKPDVEIAYGKNQLSINGSILIPKARVTPSNLAEGRITESEDVVIVAGELPEMAKTEKMDGKLEFDGNLKVELGSDVIVDLNIAQTKLSGSAVLDWQGDSLPNVDGRYDLAGSIRAFGQVLNIAEGGIRFANVPADQPYLRIRAEREIYGNSQIKTAGVLVDGVASHPTIEAYTNPRTTEERALTLLVTGSDFDLEQGIGAVDFGTYIAPRLFVSYGVGIFDRENVISARYDLPKGFGIKASSSEKQSGVDLNYRFEN